MNNKTKYFIGSIGVLGVLVGRNLNRIFPNYFGNNGSVIIMSVIVAIIYGAILMMVIQKYYKVALMYTIMSIPIVIGGIALYLDNMDIVGLSILLFLIIGLIIIKVVPKIDFRRKE